MNGALSALRRGQRALQMGAARRPIPSYSVDWTAQEKQQAAIDSEADFLFFGGQAGGGKTDLLIGAAVTCHHRSIIFRREYEQLKGIIDRASTMVGGRQYYSGGDKVFRLPDGRHLELGGVQHPGDEEKWQGRPHDLKAFDEIGHFVERQFRFLCGWNRPFQEGQRCRVICAGNPPTTPEGEWVIQFWGPWLNPEYPNPAAPGELRWFVRLDDEDREVDGPNAVRYKGRILRPMSRTFIPATLEDNVYLARDGNYQAVLDGLPEPLRSQMRDGNFQAGREDSAWQLIPTAWVIAAQERWTPKPPGPLSALGVDPARGGGDRTAITPRCGVWFGRAKIVPGVLTPDGDSVADLVEVEHRHGASVNIDVLGIGSSPYDSCKKRFKTRGLVSSKKSTGHDRTHKLTFKNKRAEWWWKFREALDPELGDDLALPPGRDLRMELTTTRYKILLGGVIIVEEKDSIIKRLGRSPDEAESAIYAHAEQRKHYEVDDEGGEMDPDDEVESFGESMRRARF